MKEVYSSMFKFCILTETAEFGTEKNNSLLKEQFYK